ncbi:MAG: RNA 2',3'-cyclic phosphodiesterase [Anaerolineaceae bacterium]|nr:RNA 2',3'-cyclic phosphodiesterase [Anaerolineaceae bacterium]
MTKQTIRSFIAVPLPIAVQQTLEEWIQQLKQRQKSGVRWVNTANMHLTMKFLGDLQPEQISAIQEEMRATAAQITAFSFDLKGIGTFPGLYKPRVIWVGVTTPPAMQQLHHHLMKRLEAIGFPAEERKFSPHLTLGRISRHASEKEIAGVSTLLRQPPKIALPNIPVDSLHLYRSDLRPGGSVYTLLEQSPLKES